MNPDFIIHHSMNEPIRDGRRFIVPLSEGELEFLCQEFGSMASLCEDGGFVNEAAVIRARAAELESMLATARG